MTALAVVASLLAAPSGSASATTPVAVPPAAWYISSPGLTWQEQQPGGPAPSPRFAAASAAIPGVGVWVFGGVGPTLAPLGDSWLGDPSTGRWTSAPTLPGGPPADLAPAAVYLPDRNAIVEFDGMHRQAFLLDLTQRQWVPLPAPALPGPILPALAYAPSGLVALLATPVGGGTSQVWFLDLVQKTWTRGADAPGRRAGAAFTYDKQLAAVVLAGGDLTDGRTYALAPYPAATWAPLAGAAPPPRTGASLAYDESHRRLVLLGGFDAAGAPLSDEWTYDTLTGWQQRSGPLPPARGGATLGIDALTGRSLLFGGRSGSSVLGDTWTSTSTPEWHAGPTYAEAMPPRAQAATAVTQTRTCSFGMCTGWHDAAVLFGGRGPDGTVRGDTWLAQTNTNDSTQLIWQQVTGPGPSPRTFATWVGPVLFGGLSADGRALADTWLFDSTNGRWTQLFPTVSPPARAAAASLPGGYLFGGKAADGTLLDDEWQLGWREGSYSWQQVPLTGSHPSARAGAAVLDGGILFGGLGSAGFLGDTWQVDTSTGQWASVDAGTAVPAPRAFAATTADFTVDPPNAPPDVPGGPQWLLDGLGAGGPIADAWRFDPATHTWQQVMSHAQPPARWAAFAVDAGQTGQVLLTGGTADGVTSLTDSWALGSADLRLLGLPFVDFGAVPVGTQATRSVRLVNPGSTGAPLHTSYPVYVPYPLFVDQLSCPWAPGTLQQQDAVVPADSSCTLSFTFAPTTTGAQFNEVSLTTPAGTFSALVILTGRGV